MLNQITPAELISRIELLCAEKEAILPMVQSFKERVICTYQVGVLLQLKTAFESENAAQVVEQVLAENWKHVKGTLLCYTAQPKDCLTLLLCDIAQHLSAEIKKPALTILMPGLLTEMMPDDLIKGELKTILCTHILSECGKYVLPIDILCALTLPENPNQPWFNPYYDSNDVGENFSIKPNEKGRLFYHSSETAVLLNAKEEYNRFLNKESLLGHLNELVQKLRFNGAHHGVGSQENAGEGAYAAIIRFNDYYTLLGDEQKSRIPEKLKSEIDKLIVLSSDKSKNINATKNMQTCIGTREEKMRPEIAEHQLLLNEIGIDADKSTELLGKAKDLFEKQIETLKEKLAQNQYQGSDKLPVTKALLEHLKVPLNISTPEELNDFLRCNPKEMHNILSNNKNIQAQIVDQLRTLETFVTLALQTSSQRLKVLLFHIGKSFVEKHIHSIDDISACLIFLDEERLNIVLNTLQVKIKTGLDFNALLNRNTPEKRAVLYKAFKDKLPRIINNTLDFGNVFLCLTKEQRAETYATFKDKLPEIIHSAVDFMSVLSNLTPEQRVEVYTTFKDKLPGMIHSAANFIDVLSRLTPEQRIEIYEAFKEKLPGMINNHNDFRCVLYHLAEEQCVATCHAIKNKLSEIIKDSKDFYLFFMWMNHEKRTIAFTSIKDELVELIKTADDFSSLLDALSFNETDRNLCTEIYEKTKDKLLATTKNAECFLKVAKYLTPLQCLEIYASVKKSLPKTIKNANHFHDILKHLTPEQSTELTEIAEVTELYKAVKDKLPKFIKAAVNFHDVLILLPPSQRTEVYEAVKKKLPQFIKASRNFPEILEVLTPEQRIEVYELSKDNLPKVIKSTYDFTNILCHLTPEKRMEMFNSFKNELPKIIKSVDDLSSIIGYFSHEDQVEVVCTSLKDELLEIIKTACNFHNLLKYFSSQQRTVIYGLLKDKLPGMIKTANHFEQAFLYLSLPQRIELYERIRDNLPKIIRKESEFNDLCPKFDFIKEITPNYASIKQRPDPLIHQAPLLFSDGLHRNQEIATNAPATPARARARKRA